MTLNLLVQLAQRWRPPSVTRSAHSVCWTEASQAKLSPDSRVFSGPLFGLSVYLIYLFGSHAAVFIIALRRSGTISMCLVPGIEPGPVSYPCSYCLASYLILNRSVADLLTVGSLWAEIWFLWSLCLVCRFPCSSFSQVTLLAIVFVYYPFWGGLFWNTLGSTQGLPLTLCSGVTASGSWRINHVIPGIPSWVDSMCVLGGWGVWHSSVQRLPLALCPEALLASFRGPCCARDPFIPCLPYAKYVLNSLNSPVHSSLSLDWGKLLIIRFYFIYCASFIIRLSYTVSVCVTSILIRTEQAFLSHCM